MEPMLNMFGVGNEDMRFVQKQSIRKRFCSDLVTPLEDKISVPGIQEGIRKERKRK